MTLRIVGRDPTKLSSPHEGHQYSAAQLKEILGRITSDAYCTPLLENNINCGEPPINTILIHNAMNAQKNIAKLMVHQQWCDQLLKCTEKIKEICDDFVETPSDTSPQLLETVHQRLDLLLADDPKITHLQNVSEYRSEAVKIASALRTASVDNRTTAELSAAMADEVLFEIRLIRQSIMYQISDNRKHIDSQLVMRENRNAYLSCCPGSKLKDILSKIHSQNDGE